MASYSKTTPTSLADELVCVLDVGNDSQDNVTGSTSGSIFVVETDNTLNPNMGIFLNIADTADATSGQTVPTFRFYIPAGKKCSTVWSDGHAYSAGVSLWVSGTSATASTSGPNNNVIVKLLVTA